MPFAAPIRSARTLGRARPRAFGRHGACAALLLIGAPFASASASTSPSPSPTETAAEAGAGTAVPGSGPLIVEGDVFVSRSNGRRAVGVSGVGRLWRHGEIPYRFDRALGSDAVRAVQSAVERWNTLAGITFLEIEAGAPLPADHVVFEPGDGCASWVGRQGGAQSIWVGPDCTAGSVMHEIGHVLGLEHEHTRADRDAHVRIHWDRIRPEKRHNFDIAPSDTRLIGAYDLDSIMHYGAWNFSIDGAATLEAIDPRAGRRMGQRESPSAGDIAAIARLYRSDLSLVVQPDAADVAREMALYVTNEHAQGAHGLVLRLNAPGLRLPAREEGGWQCEREADGARCTLARLDGGGRSELHLVLDAPLETSAFGATLASKTPDADLSDNGFEGAAAPPLGAARGDKPLPPFADITGDGGERSPLEDSGSGGAGASSGLLLASLGALAAWRRRRRANGAHRSGGWSSGPN